MAKLKTDMDGSDRAEYGKKKKKARHKRFEKLGYFDLKDMLKSVGFRVLAKHSNEDVLVMTRKRANVRSDAVVVDKDEPRLTLRTIANMKGDMIEYLIEVSGDSYSGLWTQAEQKLSVMFASRQGRKLADGELASVSHVLSTSNYSDVRLPEVARKGYMKRSRPFEDDVVDAQNARSPSHKNDAYSYLNALVTVGHEEAHEVGEDLLKNLGVKFAKGMSFKPDEAVNYALKSGIDMKKITKVAHNMWKGNRKCQRK